MFRSLKLRKDNRQMATIMSLQAGVAFPAERLEFGSSGQSSEAQDQGQPAANQSGDDVIMILSDIKAMLQLAHDNCDPSKNRNMFLSLDALSPLGYLFDEFALAIRGNQMAPVVKEWILNKYQGMLEEVFMCDFEEPKVDEEGANAAQGLKPTDPSDAALLSVPDTLPHRQRPYAEMRFNEDGDDADFYVRILPFAISKDPATMSKLSLLVPLLRLLSACHDPRYGGSGLTEIDAVIGAPLMLMETEQAGMNYQQLPEETKRAGVMSSYHAVNWVRELLNSFVHDAAFPNFSLTQSAGDEEVAENENLKGLIVKRLSTLMDLEDDLRFEARDCESFCPPNCSKNILNLSGMSVAGLPRANTLLLPAVPDYKEMTKEDAKVSKQKHNALVKEMKAKHRQETSAYNKSQKKREQEVDKKRALLEDRVMKSLRTLSPDIVLALGFPTLAAIVGGNNSQLPASQAIASASSFRVGGKGARLLLKIMNESLENVVESKSTHWLSKVKEGPCAGADEDAIGAEADDVENPYKGCGSGVALTKLDRYVSRLLDGGVFASVHEHLVVMVEIMGGEGGASYNGGEGLSDDEKEGVKECIDSTLSIIQLLMSSEKLTVSKEGRALLCAILKQLANGEKIPRGTGVSQTSDSGTPIFFITSLKSLFDLVEEVCLHPQKNDLTFTMKVVNSLESIIGCSHRLIDALIAPCQQLEAVAGEVRKIAMSCSQKLSELAFKSLKLDWCPMELRAQRNKFSYNKGNVGVLVKVYLEHSGVDKILIDTKIPSEIAAMDVGGVGKIVALKNLADNILPGLADTEGCKGPVQAYPTLTGQR